MWFKTGEEGCLPKSDVVGLFQPEAIGMEPGNDDAKSVVLLRDGRLVFSPLGLKTLEKRYREGKL